MIDQNAYAKAGEVTAGNIRYYNEAGFLIAPGLLTTAEIDELKKETTLIFRGERGKIEGLIEVMESEPESEVLKKYVAIHFPHKISTVIYNYLSHNGIKNILTHIVGPNIKCMQSMLFVKAPGKAGQAWHQDEYFIPTRDRSLVGAWIAIDDATVENGCLWLVPGSNKEGFIRRRVDNRNAEYADVDTVDVSDFGEEEIVPVEVKRGSVVFFNGYTLHSSLKNKTTDNFRRAL